LLRVAKIQSENIMDLIFDVKGRSETDFWREKACPVTAYRRRAAIVRTASTQQTLFSSPLASILFRIELRTGSGGQVVAMMESAEPRHGDDFRNHRGILCSLSSQHFL
jgi:hypothetical protein